MRNPKPQRQDSLYSQMKDVFNAANEIGCYDAADWIKRRFFEGVELGFVEGNSGESNAKA